MVLLLVTLVEADGGAFMVTLRPANVVGVAAVEPAAIADAKDGPFPPIIDCKGGGGTEDSEGNDKDRGTGEAVAEEAAPGMVVGVAAAVAAATTLLIGMGKGKVEAGGLEIFFADAAETVTGVVGVDAAGLLEVIGFLV